MTVRWRSVIDGEHADDGSEQYERDDDETTHPTHSHSLSGGGTKEPAPSNRRFFSSDDTFTRVLGDASGRLMNGAIVPNTLSRNTSCAPTAVRSSVEEMEDDGWGMTIRVRQIS